MKEQWQVGDAELEARDIKISKSEPEGPKNNVQNNDRLRVGSASTKPKVKKNKCSSSGAVISAIEESKEMKQELEPNQLIINKVRKNQGLIKDV